MNWVPITFISAVFLSLLAIVVALSRHKKSATGEIQLIGSSAQVDSPLGPEGTVLVQGELWRARSADGTEIAPQTVVEIVGLSGHLLLVSVPNFQSFD